MIEYARIKRHRSVVSRLRYHGIVLTLALFAIVGVISLAKADTSLTFATSKSGWLVWLAEERGLFEKNGVDVKVELVTSGVAAAKGLISGDYDLATMSEYAFVAKNFLEDDLRLIGTVGAISNLRLIGRRDHGVTDVASLSGKRVGLLEGAISQFFLGKLLDINGIDPKMVTVVNFRPPSLPNVLKAGEVDAILSWEPYASNARDVIGDAAVEVNVQGGQSYYFTIATKAQTVSDKPDALQNVIAALIQAADWAAANQPETQDILHQKLGIPRADLEKFWPDHVMDVTLTQDMVFLMAEEAIWRSESGLSSGNIPDFLNRIYFDALDAVDSSRISVIR